MKSRGFVFGALVEDGRIVFDDRTAFDRRLRSLTGKRIELLIRKPRSKRSLAMNAYLHHENGPIRLLAEYFGDSIEGTKYALMGECFGWVKSHASSNLVPAKAHTSEMTREESKYFVDWVIPWAAQLPGGGVMIPLPNESF